MATRDEDLEVLVSASTDLLTGRLTVGAGLLKLGGPLKRHGKDPEWMARGVVRALRENEELLPLVIAHLGETGARRLRQLLEARYPDDHRT